MRILFFIPNRWTGSDVKTDVNIVFSTRDANFVNTKALVTIPKAGTNSVAVHPKTGEVFLTTIQKEPFIVIPGMVIMRKC